MFSKGSRGFGVPDCGLAAHVAVHVFGEAPKSAGTNKRKLTSAQIRGEFMKRPLDRVSYCMGEKSVARMYTSSTRNTLPALSIRGFAASTYGRNAGSVWSASQFFFASSRLR